MRVFVYGSLKRGQYNHLPWCSRVLDIQPAWVRGRLWDLPAGYPALQLPLIHQLPTGSCQPVHGEVLTFPDDPMILADLDRLEECREDGRGLYRRLMVLVRSQGQPVKAWTYVMDRLPPGARHLPGGVWPGSGMPEEWSPPHLGRPMCWRCRWPKDLCWCFRIQAMDTRSRVIILMHPKEARHVKINTGRLTHLGLKHSELLIGEDFSSAPPLCQYLDSSIWQGLVLYPSPNPWFAKQGLAALGNSPGPGTKKRLCIFVLDATWSCARTMYRRNTWLHPLPHAGLQDTSSSAWLVKHQPKPHCLSTMEAVHRLLVDLAAAGLDQYPRPRMFPALFQAIQEYQVSFSPGADPRGRDGG